MTIQVHVFDTHVHTKEGHYFHFDVLVTDENVPEVKQFAANYLKTMGVEAGQIKQDQCQFCHSEVANPEVKHIIEKQGYYIIPLQGCA